MCYHWRMPSDSRPIGLFDSGVGGLTVLRAVARRLPGERLAYFGDTARVPYGTKSAETITRYAVECGSFLAARGVKLLIVACNSASAVAIPALRDRLDIPVIGVVEAGARAAAAATSTGRVGVIGTEGTIKSGAYPAALHALNPRLRVLSQPCPLFVPLVEEGWLDDPVTRLVAERYLQTFLPAPHERSCGERVDTVILGCTHYPLLASVIGQVLGRDVRLVDSAEVVAEEAASLMARENLAAPPGARPDHDYFVSDLSDRFLRIAERILGHPLGRLAAVAPGDYAETDWTPGDQRHHA